MMLKKEITETMNRLTKSPPVTDQLMQTLVRSYLTNS